MEERHTLLKELLKKEHIKRIIGVKVSKSIFSLAVDCGDRCAIIEYLDTVPEYLGFIFDPHYLLTEGVIGVALQISPSLYYLKKELLSSFK